MINKTFSLTLLIINLLFSQHAFGQCNFQIGLGFESPLPDTINITVSKSGWITSNSPLIKIFIFNENFCKIGINNIPSSNITFRVEKKEGERFMYDSICNGSVEDLVLPEEGLQKYYTSEKQFYQTIFYPNSCINIHASGEFRIKYYFSFEVNSTTKTLETPWLYFYLKRLDE